MEPFDPRTPIGTSYVIVRSYTPTNYNKKWINCIQMGVLQHNFHIESPLFALSLGQINYWQIFITITNKAFEMLEIFLVED